MHYLLQNPTVSIYTANFVVGSNKQSNLLIKDQTISGVLCNIKLTKVSSHGRTFWYPRVSNVSKHTHTFYLIVVSSDPVGFYSIGLVILFIMYICIMECLGGE